MQQKKYPFFKTIILRLKNLKIFAIFLAIEFIAIGPRAFAGEKIEIKRGNTATESIIFEEKVVDGMDAYYLEHNTLQNQKVFRAVTKKEFENVGKGFSKLNELLKKKGKIVSDSPCAESIEMIVYAITQNICIDKFSKKEKKQLAEWFKKSSEIAAGPTKK